MATYQPLTGTAIDQIGQLARTACVLAEAAGASNDDTLRNKLGELSAALTDKAMDILGPAQPSPTSRAPEITEGLEAARRIADGESVKAQLKSTIGEF